ncbi:MAG: S41 family peptidase [Lachnospiraceae bacterium]|nr:S41 family peptidase [Lachnospiraceae bacterium]
MENEVKAKSKFWKGVLVGSLVTAFVGLIIVGIAAGINLIGQTVMDNQAQIQMAEEEEETENLDLGRVNQKIETLEQLVDRYFLFDENVDQEQMEAGIYKGMLAGLEDPYTIYYTREEYESLTEETEGVYCGIGVLVSQNISSGLITAIRVFQGSPAEEAGMKKGDILYKVGDVETGEMELDVLVQQEIRGEEGTYVDITVIRDGEMVDLHIQRRIVEVTTVESQMLEDQIGYIMVTQFELVTGDQFKAAVDELEKQGMKGLIIDLRDNPGGVLDAVIEMAAYILPEDKMEGTIVSTSDKNGIGDRYYSKDGKIRFKSASGQIDPRYPKEDGHQVELPIVVLMNGNSASASEVLAGALRDYGSAKLVGTTSFGKGIVQSVIQLEDGSAIKMTTSHYYTPGGVDLHKKGLEPDVEVEQEIPEDLKGAFEIPLDRDNQVKKAIEVLKEAY